MCKNFEGSAELSSANKNFTVPRLLDDDKIENDYHVNLNGLDTRKPKTKTVRMEAQATSSDKRHSRGKGGHGVLDVSPHGVDTLNISPPQQDQQKGSVRPLKKRRVTKDGATPTFPFFGPHLPRTPKIIALRCFDFLDGKSIYSSSIVSSLWCQAALDDALWE